MVTVTENSGAELEDRAESSRKQREKREISYKIER